MVGWTLAVVGELGVHVAPVASTIVVSVEPAGVTASMPHSVPGVTVVEAVHSTTGVIEPEPLPRFCALLRSRTMMESYGVTAVLVVCTVTYSSRLDWSSEKPVRYWLLVSMPLMEAKASGLMNVLEALLRSTTYSAGSLTSTTYANVEGDGARPIHTNCTPPHCHTWVS